MPLFDRTQIPTGVFKDETLGLLDAVYDECKARQKDEIRPTSGRHPSEMADALLQSYLWRGVELAEATADMVHRGRWMPALILARITFASRLVK